MNTSINRGSQSAASDTITSGPAKPGKPQSGYEIPIHPDEYLMPPSAGPDEPFLALCHVSIHSKADHSKGVFSIQLSTGGATLTACVTLDHCTDYSLDTTAHEVAVKHFDELLAMLRTSVSVSAFTGKAKLQADPTPSVDVSIANADEERKLQATPTVESAAKRYSYWVSQIRMDGGESMGGPKTTAEFAEFAFNEG